VLLVATIHADGDFLPWKIVLFEVVEYVVDEVVETRNGLELNFAEDGAFEGFGKRLFDFSTSSELL
jgi:hypothetical protein